ncbi:efflux RND transporter periplasmic adaptor subunit [uncultured Albimonas sp.]|uniref:efflux RND transporter periplasmic adaptor subunit n=1 Tax=uncultured Albimonas sp. TaxID=1331701 RepID=UPI0030EBE8D9|tara:strand:+ start:1560 stop:2702 length:1143 start_codon:yes stop_codon:yes gene_type:complete
MIAPHRSRPRPTRRSTLARRALALVALAAAALAPLVPAAQEAAAPAPETLRPAKLMRLGERSAPVERVFYGRVTARATVDMAFQASGQLLRLPVEEGARVDRGALLGQLDLGPFERAERRASAELNRVRTDLNRLQNLGSDVVPQTRIDDTSTQLELAEVQHEQALYDLEHATLTAPFDALIASRQAEVYATVSAGQPVVRLHDMSELQVEVEAPEILFRRVGGAAEVEARARIAGAPESWRLTLRELKTETGDRGQTYTVTFAFADPPPAFLLPGASVSVSARLRTPDPDAPPAAPAAALRYDAAGEPQVLVFEPDAQDPDAGVVRAAPVTVEVASDGALRMSEGPGRGTEIVASGASQLEDGMRVRRWTGLATGRAAR